MSRYYLGLDSSTQSLTAVLINADSNQLLYELSFNYAEELPHYGCSDGFLDLQTAGEVHAPPLMWVEALDSLLMKLHNDGLPMQEIIAVSGAAQQHGTVYLNNGFAAALNTLQPQSPLHHQIQHCFSRQSSPIWMDNSTSAQCAQINQALGGADEVNRISGSVAIERFSGPQIKKFADSQPQAYKQTSHIMLVSSFLTSLFAGRPVGVDYTDASGTNLFDITKKQWHAKALHCCAEQLAEKLSTAVNPQTVLGRIAPYFVQRYGFNIDCLVLPWCGDNPSSLVGLGLVEPGMTAISLGTSDTLFGLFQQLPKNMSPWAHTFIAPTLDYMSLLCFRNGSLAREAIRNRYQLSWDDYNQHLAVTPPGNHGAMMLPWFESETVPKVEQSGGKRFNLDENDIAANCRAVIEAQMMAMRHHAELAGLSPTSIHATGGASQNQTILQIMADVFKCPVEVLKTTNSTALGAALRAIVALEKRPWQEIVDGFSTVQTTSRLMPDQQAAAIYRQMKKQYIKLETDALNN